MKPSQFAKGFQARPDTTSSEKRTALDRLNAIDGIVKSDAAPKAAQLVGRSRQPIAEITENSDQSRANESFQYLAWPTEQGYAPGQKIDLTLKAIKPSSFNPRH